MVAASLMTLMRTRMDLLAPGDGGAAEEGGGGAAAGEAAAAEDAANAPIVTIDNEEDGQRCRGDGGGAGGGCGGSGGSTGRRC